MAQTGGSSGGWQEESDVPDKTHSVAMRHAFVTTTPRGNSLDGPGLASVRGGIVMALELQSAVDVGCLLECTSIKKK